MNHTPRTPEEEAARRERIARLAHQIWESEGRPEGQAMRHWSMAERLIEAEEEQAAAAPQPQAKAKARRNGRPGKKTPAAAGENRPGEGRPEQDQPAQSRPAENRLAENRPARNHRAENGLDKQQRPPGARASDRRHD